jgi:hypothetical protein
MLIGAAVIVVSCLSFGGVAGASGGVSAKVQNWYVHEGGKHYLAEFVSDLHKIENDFKGQHIVDLGSDCTSMDADVEDAQNILPPIPSKSMERSWSRVLSDFSKAIENCEDGSTLSDSNQLNRSATQFNAGIKILGALRF